MMWGLSYAISRMISAQVELLDQMAVLVIIGGLVLLGVVNTLVFSELAVNNYVNMKTNKIHLY
jgi:hypothetical protein